MKTEVFDRRIRLEVSAAEAFAWHVRPGALERLTPPWESVQVIERTGGLQPGGRVVLNVRVGPCRRRWISEHYAYEEGHSFSDRQLEGPFASWNHTHRFDADGPSACSLTDHIEYQLPYGPLGRFVAGTFIRRRLERLFRYRHRITTQDLAARRASGHQAPLHLAVTGSHGLVGSALVAFLMTSGHRVSRLVRSPPRPESPEIFWDPLGGTLDARALEGVDAVVHLAGESIAAGRWTAQRKRKMWESRVVGTKILCESLAKLAHPPKVVVSASAIGYYGDRGDERLDEESPPGDGFLAELCRAWEAASVPASQRGIRVVHLRIGVVLSPAGGALAKMLLPFRFGIGGRLGPGNQFMSWVAIDDVIGAIEHVLMTESLYGPVNAVAPTPVTNREFTKTLGNILARPTSAPVPAAVLHFLLGELADQALLASAQVVPAKLLASGYRFRYADLEDALRHLLGR